VRSVVANTPHPLLTVLIHFRGGSSSSSASRASSSATSTSSSATSTSSSLSDDGKKSSALPIALGVVIPVIVALLAVIAFFLYRRRRGRSGAQSVGHHKPGVVALDSSKEDLNARPTAYGSEPGSGMIPLIPSTRREKTRAQPLLHEQPQHAHYQPQSAQGGMFYPTEGSSSDGYGQSSSGASDSLSPMESARRRALPVPPGQQGQGDAEALPTEALVRVLQNRLRAQGGGEAPPAYDSGR
jgi:hypothetical protein